jgi:hypothetical protein
MRVDEQKKKEKWETETAKQTLSVLDRQQCIHVRKVTIVPR